MELPLAKIGKSIAPFNPGRTDKESFKKRLGVSIRKFEGTRGDLGFRDLGLGSNTPVGASRFFDFVDLEPDI